MPLKHILLAISVAFIWGVNFIVIKGSLETIPPFTMGLIRFGLASLPILFGVRFPKTHWKYVVAIGILQGFIKFSFLFFGVSLGLASCHASLTLQTQAFFTTLFAFLFLGSIVTLNNILGIFISFVGLGIMGHEAQGGVAFSGMIMILLAAMFWGLSNIFYKKVGKVDMFALIVWSGAVSVPFFAVASWCFEGMPVYTHIWEVFDYKLLGMVIYVSFVATWYGSTALGFLLNRYNPATVAPYTLLVSVFAILTGYVVLDERLSMQSSTACLIVIVGLCINQLPGHIDIFQFFKTPFRKPEIV